MGSIASHMASEKLSSPTPRSRSTGSGRVAHYLTQPTPVGRHRQADIYGPTNENGLQKHTAKSVHEKQHGTLGEDRDLGPPGIIWRTLKMAKHTMKKCRSIRGKRVCKSKTKRAVKGARSKTHRGEKDYTTKKGDKVFHRKGHDEKHAAKSRKVRKPYVKSKKGGLINLPNALYGPGTVCKEHGNWCYGPSTKARSRVRQKGGNLSQAQRENLTSCTPQHEGLACSNARVYGECEDPTYANPHNVCIYPPELSN